MFSYARAVSDAVVCFFFNDTATTEIYTLSLHDALPIWRASQAWDRSRRAGRDSERAPGGSPGDRKSTRLNSSHPSISYAVFCLKKKKNPPATPRDLSDLLPLAAHLPPPLPITRPSSLPR